MRVSERSVKKKREGRSFRKKVEQNERGGKQEESKVFKEASGGIIATRKTDSSGEEKTGVTSTELQGWATCFYFSKMLKTRLYMKL